MAHHRNKHPLNDKEHYLISMVLLLPRPISKHRFIRCEYFSVSADGTLRMWDIEGIKELKVIDLESRESRVTRDFVGHAILVNGNRWAACFSGTHLGLFDLESGLFMKSIDLQIDQEYIYTSSKNKTQNTRCKRPRRVVRLRVHLTAAR